MGSYKVVDGDLIKLALQGEFDVIAHGCNCFCNQKSGLAPQMVKAFRTDDFNLEQVIKTTWDHYYDDWYEQETTNKGDINKLGQIDYEPRYLHNGIALAHNPFIDGRSAPILTVVNAYTQYHYGLEKGGKKPVDYLAIGLVMKKINHIFKGKKVGLPKIGAGLAGGDWQVIEGIIKTNLTDCDVTIVNYVPDGK